ncbi:DUF262 domain-containing protein [Clostridium cochlearium]|uniref:DUF262 domain-containing protein n=1 Tax=Clostridium cochlearium TaxID=1494 RepID=UPI000B94D38D|nr:DUF262 domain-containing protein [Clostridium cochlearium]SNV87702.1 Uncharacterized conserved protein [Clostridium cochlearium]STA93580.1 Uncharacterized conserved protein [Clostridium cochlearium]
MEAGKIRLVELINANKRTFNIPVYQRNYDWKNSQCERLFKDIENIASANNEIEHFLGTIVFVVERTLPTFTEYILIDGQQRITSIMLLIKALYDSIEEDYIKQDILESFLTNRNAPEKYRIKLKSIESDRAAYEQIISGQVTSSDSNIINNYKLFKKLIEDSEFKPVQIYEALNYIDIVFISLDKGKKSENPQMIFESLNSTGLSLTQADLIRNYLLMNHSYEKQNFLYNEYWLKIENKITNARISDFVRDYLTMKTGRIPVKNNVYNEFKDYLKDNNDVDEEGVLEDLLVYSKYYSWFLLCKSPYASINDLLQQIQQLKSTVIYPTLLFVFEDCFEYKTINIDELVDILKVFISYLYRRMVCGYATNALNKVFGAFPNDFKKNTKDTYKEKVLEILTKKSGTAIFPRNEEFKSAFTNKNFYATKLDMYTLYQLEKHKNKEVISLNKDITIEHIMPQKLTPIWRRDLGKKYDEIHMEYLHTIGNLTLTAYNGNLSNKNFKDKKEVLSSSNIAISRNISNYTEWNEVSIKDRANKMFDIANEIWHLPIEYNKPMGDSKEFDYDIEYNLIDGTNFTGEVPRKVIIGGMEYSIDSWRDLLRKTSDELYYLDKEIFKSLVLHKDFEGISKRRVSNTKENMNSPYQVGEDLYIDLHGSAVEIVNYCVLLAEKFDMENEISIMLKAKYN